MSKARVSYQTQNNKVNLKDFIEPIESDFALAEKQLNSNLIDDNQLITDMLALVFQAGGKRIRPLIVLHSGHASTPIGEQFNHLQIVLAVLTELIHTASLVHDDILDSAATRRGHQTINKRFSDRLAVLLGDLLFAQASICLAKIMSPAIVGIYGQVLGDLCSGEIQQMKQQFLTTLTREDYIKKSIAKTASLFAAGTESSAILNKASDEIVTGLKSYGLHLGICFQIIDDLLDFTSTSETLGKEAGSDLKGGIITAPALFVLERKDAPAKQLESLISTREICETDGLKAGLELIKNNGGIEKTVDLAQSHVQKAKDCLQVLPSSVYRDSLAEFTDYVFDRVN